MFTILDTDNNAYTEYYKRLKARGDIPTDYMGSIHHHHFRLKTDTLRDDNDFIECTKEEHIELHRLMNECYPCNKTNGAYQFTRGWRNDKEEAKRKMSEAHKGKHHSEETKRKMSEALKGANNPIYGKSGKNHPAYGRKHTEEELAKMSKQVKVIFNNSTEMIFNSAKECADYLKVDNSGLSKYIKGKLKIPKRCNVREVFYL